MKMDLPGWADENLSKELPTLRARGESQHLEYKTKLPTNMRDLAKEIAAFATSNAGTILIGVDDSGGLVGLEGTQANEGRDEILRRVEGVCSGAVRPAITPSAKFAVEDRKAVLVLSIPKGRQPVYYSNNIPYVRHLTTARPAEPHEVIELVTDHLATLPSNQKGSPEDPQIEFYSRLARVLDDVIIYADEAPERMFNPWLNQWRAGFGYAAASLRGLLIEDVAIRENIHGEIDRLAQSLDAVAQLRMHFGSGPELEKLRNVAAEQGRKLKMKCLSKSRLDGDSLKHIRDLIIATGRKLQQLNSRATDLVKTGRTEELQSEASKIGLELLQLAHYNIDSFEEDVRVRLIDLGRRLHLIETVRLYMDGGNSQSALIGNITDLGESLNSVVAKLSGSLNG
jgi:ATP-dependent DNA helicase RecG